MSSLKEKTASGLFWAAMNNGSMQILNAIIGIFLARLLSPARIESVFLVYGGASVEPPPMLYSSSSSGHEEIM